MPPATEANDSTVTKARTPHDPSTCEIAGAQNPHSCEQGLGSEPPQGFSHPARAISERAMEGDGPYRCQKCGDAVLTVTVTPCPACLDAHPWFPPRGEMRGPFLTTQDCH